jgi:virginiamycin B lyase
MLSRPLLAAGCLTMAVPALTQEQRWLGPADRGFATDGAVQAIALPGSPTTVALDDDGRLWFTLGPMNAIGRIDPDGTGFAEFPIPTPQSSPRIISLGADGNMWFSEHGAGNIGRITPAGEIAEFALSSPDSQPRAIALAADGNIWVGLFAAGRVARITPEGAVTEFDLTTPDSGPRALAAGPDGNVWYSGFKANLVGRITPEGVVTEFPMPRPNSGPGDITAGPDGNLWLVELGGVMDGIAVDGNRVARVTPDGEITEFPIPSAGGTPINIAAGPDGNVWYTKGAAIGRVTMSGDITEFPIEGARATGISAGSDRQPPARLVNRLYVTDPANNRILYLRFD